MSDTAGYPRPVTTQQHIPPEILRGRNFVVGGMRPGRERAGTERPDAADVRPGSVYWEEAGPLWRAVRLSPKGHGWVAARVVGRQEWTTLRRWQTKLSAAMWLVLLALVVQLGCALLWGAAIVIVIAVAGVIMVGWLTIDQAIRFRAQRAALVLFDDEPLA